MSTKKKNPKKSKSIPKRNEVYIRISDIEPTMFEAICKNAEANHRTNGVEVLIFLEKNNYN